MGTPLETLYVESRDTPGPENQLVPAVWHYATGCRRVVQIGVGPLTGGLLRARPEEIAAFDPLPPGNVPRLQRVAADIGVRWSFSAAVQAEIGDPDMLILDRRPHLAESLRADLALAANVRRYILVPGTERWSSADEPHPGMVLPSGWPRDVPPPSTGPGLWVAIGEFLRAHDDWRLGENLAVGIGMVVLVRVGGGQ